MTTLGHHSIFLALLAAFLCLCPSRSESLTYYADSAGTNGNSCTTARTGGITNPTLRKGTINGGIGCLSSGDTLVVGAGNYTEVLTTIPTLGSAIPNGSNASTYTSIQAETLHTPIVTITPVGDYINVLEMADTSNGALVAAANIHFRGLVLHGNNFVVGTGLSLAPSTQNIYLQDIFIRQMEGMGVQGGGQNHKFINVNMDRIGYDPDSLTPGTSTPSRCGLTFNFCLNGAGFYADYLCAGFCHGYYIGSSSNSATFGHLVEGGLYTNIDGHVFHWYGGGSTLRNVTVENARVGAGFYSQGGNLVYNNVFRQVGVPVLVGWASHTIAGNTLYTHRTTRTNHEGQIPESYGIYVKDPADIGSGSTMIKNNLLVQQAVRAELPYLYIEAPSGNALVSNPTFGGQVAGNLCDQASMVGCATASPSAPYFVDGPGGNLALASLSPARDAGVALGPPLNVDILGVTRPQGAQYDAGAYEFTGTASTPAYLAFSVQPSTAVSDVTLSPAIKVEVRDAAHAVVPTGTYAVTLSLQANPTGATLSGTLTQPTIDGTATFSDLSVNLPGTGYTLRALTTGIPDPQDQSDFFTITPAPPTGLLAPSNLRSTLQTVTATGEQQMAWDYTQGSPLATGFNVYVQSTCTGSFTLRPGQPQALTPQTHTQSGLALGSTTCWRVTARDASAAESPPSNTLSWAIPAAPLPPAPTELSVSQSSGFFLAR